MKGRAGERGYSLVALMAGITILSIATAIALPAWKYVIKNDREEELLFRGGQIADAIRRYQTKNGNALPASLEVLVKGKFLRKPFKDPMTGEDWRLIRQGEIMGGGRPPGPSPSPGASPGLASPRPSPSPSPGGRSTIGSVGTFVGVASRSTDSSIRLFNNRQRYDEWWFVAGQPRVVGRQLVSPAQPNRPGGPGGPGAPGGPGRPGTPPGR